MSNAQKNYLKKWAIALACILIPIVLIVFCVLGNPWDWIAFGVVAIVVLGIIVFLIVEAIGSTIWHWRLMGECKTEWETDTLSWWWPFMNYHSGNWEQFIPRMIDDEYTDEYRRQEAIALFERFKAVKPPKWYWKESEG